MNENQTVHSENRFGDFGLKRGLSNDVRKLVLAEVEVNPDAVNLLAEGLRVDEDSVEKFLLVSVWDLELAFKAARALSIPLKVSRAETAMVTTAPK